MIDEQKFLAETESIIAKNDVDLAPTITVSVERIEKLCRMIRKRDEKVKQYGRIVEALMVDLIKSGAK